MEESVKLSYEDRTRFPKTDVTGYTYILRKVDREYWLIDGKTQKRMMRSTDGGTLLQETLNIQPRYNKSVKLVGEPGSEDWSLPNGLTLPTLQNYLLDAKDVTLTLGKGESIRIDSIMDTKLLFGVIAQPPATDTPALLVKPEGDSEIIGAEVVNAVIDSGIEVYSIAGGTSPYPTGSVGLKIDCSLGSFRHTHLKVTNIHGFATSVYMPNPATGQINMGNTFEFLRTYECEKCMQVGDAGVTPRIYGNKGKLIHIAPLSGGDGIEFASSNDLWECLFFENVAAGRAIILDDVADNLSVFASTSIKPFGITDNSTAKNSKVLTVQEFVESEWATQYVLVKGAGATITGNASTTYVPLTGSRLRWFPEHFWNNTCIKEVWLEARWDPATAVGGLRLINETTGSVIETLEPGVAGWRFDYVDITTNWTTLMASGHACAVQTKGDGVTPPSIELAELRIVCKLG